MNLVVHQGALGDWALILPVVRALRGLTAFVAPWSRARLTAQLIPAVEPFNIESPAWSALHGDDAADRLDAGTSQLLRRVQVVISFVSGKDDPWAHNMQSLAPQAHLVLIDPNPPSGWRGHVGDWHLLQLQQQNLRIAPQQPPALTNPHGPIVLHPGSGSPKKCWPADRFEGLLERLRDRGCPTRVLLGEVELETWPSPLLDRWLSRYGAEAVDSLESLLCALQTAGLFVGNDAGPTHLAVQIGLPTLALFGPTDATRWAPRGPRVHLLAPPSPADMDWLRVDDVLAAVSEQTASSS
jgi:hypothetical protein